MKLLNLSQNALDDLPPALFEGLNLSVIDLSHNKLRTLNATQFDLENLTTLDLRGNRLTDSTRRELARLKVELHVDRGAVPQIAEGQKDAFKGFLVSSCWMLLGIQVLLCDLCPNSQIRFRMWREF